MRLGIVFVVVVVLVACGEPPLEAGDYEWNLTEHPGTVRVPAGLVRRPPCPNSATWSDVEDEWVDEFDIDEYPVRMTEFESWEHDYRQQHPAEEFRALPLLGLVQTERPYIASLYCRSRGMELPTIGELLRAARGTRDNFDWGNRWNLQPVCFRWTPRREVCPWRTRSNTVFALFDVGDSSSVIDPERARYELWPFVYSGLLHLLVAGTTLFGEATIAPLARQLFAAHQEFLDSVVIPRSFRPNRRELDLREWAVWPACSNQILPLELVDAYRPDWHANGFRCVRHDLKDSTQRSRSRPIEGA